MNRVTYCWMPPRHPRDRRQAVSGGYPSKADGGDWRWGPSVRELLSENLSVDTLRPPAPEWKDPERPWSRCAAPPIVTTCGYIDNNGDWRD